MNVIGTADEMRAWSRRVRCIGKTVGCVPTMGALHEGHASLIRASVAANDLTILTIFVNPTQFAPHEDFSRYPRTWEADTALAERLGVDVVYAPTASDMYPADYSTYIEVGGVSEGLCSMTRPHFFRGVSTVVAKLFNATQPHRAYFGQKDAQQCAVIRRMVRDLDFGIEIVEMPIVRESDGLAMSSRNAYLSPEQRELALGLYGGLSAARSRLEQGERDAAELIATVRRELHKVKVDYIELVDGTSMAPLKRARGAVMLAAAIQVGKTRLIDNIQYTVGE